MENASKALIIAGAILLAILIISLGIIIFNQAKEVTDNSNLTEFEILQFNQKFTSYEGTNVRGSQVNSLLNAIVQNNVANQEDTSRQVSVTVTATDWQGTTKPTGKLVNSDYAKAQTGKTYSVKCSIDGKTGLVTTVTISAPGNSIEK